MKLKPRYLALCLAVAFVGCQSDQHTENAPPITTVDSLPSLQAQLDQKREAFLARSPQEVVDDYELGVREVAESGVLQTALTVGDTVPAFLLPNAHGNPVALDSLLRDGPVVLVWYRGGWCPYCNLQLRALQNALPQIKAAGGRLVAVSPELPDSSLSTSERDSLDYIVLSDQGNGVAKEFGIAYTLPKRIQRRFAGRLDIPAYNGDSSQTLPLAVSYIVTPDRTIAYAFIDPDYRRRAEPADIITALENLKTRKTPTAGEEVE
jgi:peroxiredoxin